MLSWFKRRLSVRPGRSDIEEDAAADQPESQHDASAAVSRDAAGSDRIKQSNNSKSGAVGTKSKTSGSNKSGAIAKTATKTSDAKTKSKGAKDVKSTKGPKSPKSSKKPVLDESSDDEPEQQSAAVGAPQRHRHHHHHHHHRHAHSDSDSCSDSSITTDDEVQCQPEGEIPSKVDQIDDDGDDAFIGDVDFMLDDDIADALDRGDFSCLSPEDILKEQNRRIKEVAELLNVSDAVAGNLLRHYKWRQEQLITKYFENPKAVLKELGAAPTKESSSKKSRSKKSESKKNIDTANGALLALSGEVECLICVDEYPAEDSTALSACKHTFCNDCWKQYLTMKITDGKVQVITCPAKDCLSFVPEVVVKRLVDEEVFNKYVRFVTKSFVEDNAQCTWCPAPNCGNAITADMVVSTSSSSTVGCSCGFRFCFHCKNEAHQPASCDQVREWQRKCLDDSETQHWVGANTKDCPRCHVAVEKNGGCMHMTCPRCQHEWCWLCLRNWKGHNDYYSCNRYEKAQAKKATKKESSSSKKKKFQRLEEEREKQRTALERYLHYFERYRGHDTASKMEKQIKEKAYQKMAALQLDSSTRAETQFIERGTNMLLQCHNVLKYSYVFSYFLPEDGPEKHLFHFLQQELEKTTEQLAEVLEAPGVLMKRTEAVDLTRLCQTMKDNLIKGVEQGLVA